MRKMINIFIIITFIVTICLVEQLLFQKYFSELNSKTTHIKEIIATTDDLNTNDIPYYTDDIYTYWTAKESVLCTFINHKEIDDIGIEIDKLKTEVVNNDKAKFLESLNLIKFYLVSYQHMTGINVQSIF